LRRMRIGPFAADEAGDEAHPMPLVEALARVEAYEHARVRR